MELIALHPDLIVCERSGEWSETNDKMKRAARGDGMRRSAAENTSLAALF